MFVSRIQLGTTLARPDLAVAPMKEFISAISNSDSSTLSSGETTGIALLSLVRSRYYDCVRITGVKVSKVSRVHVSTDTISTSLIKSATFISNAVDAASTL